MRLILAIVILSTTSLAGGAERENNIYTIAEKFVGHDSFYMWDLFGTPRHAVSAEEVHLLEWRIGFYTGQPDLTDEVDYGDVHMHSYEKWGQQFFGCIIQAMVDSKGIVTSVTLRQEPEPMRDVSEYNGCEKGVSDPFVDPYLLSEIFPDGITQVFNPPPPKKVLLAEELLTRHGYECGEPDGIVGGDTVAAVIDYQFDHGLGTTGEIDDGLIKHMQGQLNTQQ